MMFRYRRLQRQVNQLHRMMTVSYYNEELGIYDAWSGGCALPECGPHERWERRDIREQAYHDAWMHCGVLNAPLIAVMVD